MNNRKSLAMMIAVSAIAFITGVTMYFGVNWFPNYPQKLICDLIIGFLAGSAAALV